MLSPPQIRLVLLPLLLLSMPVLAGLALIAFRQALEAGTAEVLMMAWVLAFVIGVPALLVLLPVAERWSAHGSRAGIVPPSGEKIP